MRIKTRFLISFGINICLLALLVFILVFYSYETQKELEKNKNAQELVSQTTDLIVVGEEYLVYRYYRAFKQWGLRVNSLKELLSKMEESETVKNMRVNLDILNNSFSRLNKIYFKLEKVRKKNKSEQLVLLEEELSGQLRILSHDMITEALILSGEIGNKVAIIHKKSSAAMIASLILIILLATIASYKTLKRITVPLTALVRDANIISGGNLKHTITGVDGSSAALKDEIGELSLSFSSMTNNLVKSISNLELEVSERIKAEGELQKAHDGLDQEVKKQTTELLESNELLMTEVKARKHTEENLRKSEEKFKAMFNNAQVALFRTRISDGKLIEINKRYANIAGYSSIKECMADFKVSEAYANPDERDQLLKILKEKGSVNDYEVEIIRKDGTHIWIIFSATIFLEQGFLEGSLVDINKRKQLEEELRQSHKMESIGTIAGGIAHDFNNILYMILGNTELALDDIHEWNPAHSNLQEIKSASVRAAGIVKHLLTFSRKTDQELRPIKLMSVIQDTLNLLRATIPTTIEIRKNIPDTDEVILADPIQINQVIMNLCINAFQAMEETGGFLEISVENEILDSVTVNNYKDLTTGSYIKITVSDTGPGIDPKIIDRIYDPYFTTKEVGKGSGMGLSVVHGIVKNHEGTITVESKSGKGTTFTILFPVVTEKPEIETEITDEFLLGTEKILFIDDEQSIVDMVEQMLERLGYQVKTETNPEEALELFQLKPDQFDLVITDMTMPQMIGVKLSEKLKKIRPDIPVIICTGHSSLIDEEKAKEMGIDAYVMKPAVKQNMAKTIREVLDTK